MPSNVPSLNLENPTISLSAEAAGIAHFGQTLINWLARGPEIETLSDDGLDQDDLEPDQLPDNGLAGCYFFNIFAIYSYFIKDIHVQPSSKRSRKRVQEEDSTWFPWADRYVCRIRSLRI